MTRFTPALERADIYTRITDRILADLEAGVRPWHKPWNTEHAAGRISRPLRANGVPYQGINVLVLWSTAAAEGYGAPIWITFKQALELGGCVRKGEHGSPVVYASRITKTGLDADTGEEAERDIPFLKSYTAFNVEQVDGLPAHFYAAPPRPPEANPIERIAAIEQFFQNCRITIRHGGAQAYYMIGEDRIQMPPIEVFRDTESYYSVLSHETTHWTRHPTRLERDFGRKRWGDEGYAMEELVAEIGAAYLCADLGLSPVVPREDHAAYLASWLKALKNDNHAIFTAAAHAQRAATYLHSLQPAAVPAAQAA